MINIEHDYDYQQFKAFLGDAKRASDPLWCKIFFRPASFPLGFILYKLKIKANSVSLCSIFLSIVACALLISSDSNTAIFSSALLLLVSLCDCIDGNIARARGNSGAKGEWMDALSGYAVYAMLPLALGINLNLSNSDTNIPAFWVLIGACTSISNLFLRLIHQKFVNTMVIDSPNIDLKRNNSLFAKLSAEMGLVGWMMPALLMASITNFLNIYLLVYCFFYMFSAFIVTIMLVKKVL